MSFDFATKDKFQNILKSEVFSIILLKIAYSPLIQNLN